MNIASIRITLTEINNEKHYVTKKKRNQKKKTKKNKQKTCSDRIRTLSVSSDYAITALAQ
jgi:hypothetical protein